MTLAMTTLTAMKVTMVLPMLVVAPVALTLSAAEASLVAATTIPTSSFSSCSSPLLACAAAFFNINQSVFRSRRLSSASFAGTSRCIRLVDRKRSRSSGTLVGEAAIGDGSTRTEKTRSVMPMATTPTFGDANRDVHEQGDEDEVVDVAVIGSGMGGLAAASILSVLYNKTVGVYESHYLPGGCTHSFVRKMKSSGDNSGNNKEALFTFGSGPTIIMGCSGDVMPRKPLSSFNPVRQILEAVNQTVEWIPYDGWGMIENPTSSSPSRSTLRWKFHLGEGTFQNGPLRQFSGARDGDGYDEAQREFRTLRKTTEKLAVVSKIPAMAMRSCDDNPFTSLVPLLRYFSTLLQLIKNAEKLTGTFDSYMNGPTNVVRNKWLRNWLDALAFSLSGLPASRTSAAAMAFVLRDMHKNSAHLDHPKGGPSEIANAFVRAVESAGNGSAVKLGCHVDRIEYDANDNRVTGIVLNKGGRRVLARDGVVCNVPVWSLRDLVRHNQAFVKALSSSSSLSPASTTTITTDESSRERVEASAIDDSGLLQRCDTAEMTGSFLHLHLALNAIGLDLSQLEPHYTVMDRSLWGGNDDEDDGPCGELNMIAVSNPCVLDDSLAPDGYIVIHAYGAGNEPYEIWEKSSKEEYKDLKQRRADVLWRAVETVIPDARERAVVELIGSPLTHEKFLRRPRGTYGIATEDYLPNGRTGVKGLVLAGDGVFPGIGIPSAVITGASAANSLVGVARHWKCLNDLQEQAKL